jgi:hypothetical protein
VGAREAVVTPGWVVALLVGLFLWRTGALQPESEGAGVSPVADGGASPAEMRKQGLLIIAAGAAAGTLIVARARRRRTSEPPPSVRESRG